MSSESYSRVESDAKLALVEEQLDHKFDKLIAEIKEGFLNLNASIDKRFIEVDKRFTEIDNRFAMMTKSFDMVEKDISWMRLLLSVFIPLSVAGITLCVMVLYRH